MAAPTQSYPDPQSADLGHAAEIAALRARTAGQITAVRRAAEVALQAQETDLQEEAARRVQSAVREQQAEAARILVETMRQHDVLVARLRADAQADVAKARDRLAELRDELVECVETQAATPSAVAAPERDQAEHAEEASLRLEGVPPPAGFATLTGVVVLAGLTGALVGWLLSLWGLF